MESLAAMEATRTIQLEEYGRAVGEPLRDDEVAQVQSSGAVSLSPRGHGSYDVVAGSVVGTVVLPTLRLLIRPKAGLRNTFFLLAYGAGLTRWSPQVFPYEVEHDLLRAMAWVFEAEVRRALPRGVVRGYHPQEERLSALRGRIEMAAQVRAQQGRPFPLACRFEEFDEDVTLNRVLKAAHDALLALPGVDPAVAVRLRGHRRAFTDVVSVRFAPAAVPELAFSRLNRHWEVAGILGRLVLQQRAVRDRTGVIAGASFTLDMNKLFERFVEQVFREEAQRAGRELVAQAPRQLAPTVGMQPDLVLRASGRDVAVADAKYKLPEQGFPMDDLYQLLAYCVALGLPSGLLVYAGAHGLERLRVERSAIHLERTGIDLSAAPPEILRQARTAAQRALAAADEISPSLGAAKGGNIAVPA
jgi:5-methylcytosine-specific restriction enzyme subunit McrC